MLKRNTGVKSGIDGYYECFYNSPINFISFYLKDRREISSTAAVTD